MISATYTITIGFPFSISIQKQVFLTFVSPFKVETFNGLVRIKHEKYINETNCCPIRTKVIRVCFCVIIKVLNYHCTLLGRADIRFDCFLTQFL